MVSKTKIALTILALLSAPQIVPAFADDANSKPSASSAVAASTPATTTTTTSTTTTSTSSSKLQGSVKSLDIEAAEGLRQMGDMLKKIQRASLELMGECTRQDYISVGDPDVVGTIIIPALPDPSGMMAIGPYLPIRKDMMDYYLDQMGKLIPIYAQLVDGLQLPESIRTQGTIQLDLMRPLFLDAKTHYMNLLDMSKHLGDIHNMKIAKEAVMLHDDMQKIDDLRRQVFKLLKDSEKKS